MKTGMKISLLAATAIAWHFLAGLFWEKFYDMRMEMLAKNRPECHIKGYGDMLAKGGHEG